MNKTLILGTALLSIASFGATATLAAAPAATKTAATKAAVTQSATFAIENMTCALCPVTVKKAMQGVNGVRSVKVDFNAKTAKVDFNPAIANAKAIAAASTKAGYPASISG